MNDTQTIETPSVDSEATRALSGLDRCDSCGAQAYVRVTMASGELLFCGHHAAEHREKLQPLSEVWHDETSRLISE